MALVSLLAACGGPKPEVPDKSSASKPDTSKIEINGDASDPVNKLAIEGIADLEQYWSTQYPELYGSDYQPVEGGFFAVIPSSGNFHRAPPMRPTFPATPSTARPRMSSHGTPRACYLG